MDSFDLLHDLFGQMYRSLLQYVGESWPWSPVQKETEEHVFLQQLLTSRMKDVKLLAEYLAAHRIPLFPPQYPVTFTDLQYLSLEHLIGEVTEDEVVLLSQLEAATVKLQTFPEACELVKGIVANEKKIVEQLRSFSAKSAAAAV